MTKCILSCAVLMLPGCGRNPVPKIADHPPERIISLAPSITDTLYDLGLDSRLVGVSRFGGAQHASDIPVVGDFMNVNYERIVSLRPDLVIIEQSADAQKARLGSLGIPYLETCSLSIDDVVKSILAIGSACDADVHAQTLVNQFSQRMEELRNQLPHRPRTLMTFSDFSNGDRVEQVYAFGADCIHSELLSIAGGDNVVTETRPSVTLSREAVIRLNPELIIELNAGGPANHWDNLPSVDAVQHNRIFVLDGTYTTIPAPGSLLQTLEDLSTIVRQSHLFP
jgi:iron complex transport system substrate-binding protein